MGNVGLALSGGGFRATLFHLGVIRALREQKLIGSHQSLLRSVTHISSVSGGSVLGAHLAMHWESYNGSEDDFEKVSSELLNFIKSDVRGNIVRNVPVLIARRFASSILAFAGRMTHIKPLERLGRRQLERASTTYLLEKRLRQLFRTQSFQFSIHDIKDAKSLVGKFKVACAECASANDKSSDLTRYLIKILSPETKASLNDYIMDGAPDSLCLKRLVSDLNKIIASECIYTDDRFLRITLSRNTRRLLDKRPQGENRMRLNRMLLADAYPYELTKQGKTLTLEALPANPHLYLLGTNLSDQCLSSFSKDGFERNCALIEKEPAAEDSSLTIAEAVAASAAFPGLFRPVNINRNSPSFSDSKPCLIADAGIHDNLGVSRLLLVPENDGLTTIIVSDASKILGHTVEKPSSSLSTLLRAMDIIHARSSELQEHLARNLIKENDTGKSLHFIKLSNDKLLSRPRIPTSRQKPLKHLRTDFDVFNVEEMRNLIAHGYCAAWHTLNSGETCEPFEKRKEDSLLQWFTSWPFAAAPIEETNDANPEESPEATILKNGAERKLHLFSIRDLDSWWHAGMLAVLVTVCIFTFLALRPKIGAIVETPRTVESLIIIANHSLSNRTVHEHALTNALFQKQTEISSLKNKMQVYEDANASLKNQIATNSLDLASAASRLAEQKQNVGRMEVELSTSQTSNASLQAANRRLNEQFAAIVSVSNVLEVQTKSSIAKLKSEYESGLTSLERQLINLTNELEANKKSLTSEMEAHKATKISNLETSNAVRAQGLVFIADYLSWEKSRQTVTNLAKTITPYESTLDPNLFIHSIDILYDFRQYSKEGLLKDKTGLSSVAQVERYQIARGESCVSLQLRIPSLGTPNYAWVLGPAGESIDHAFESTEGRGFANLGIDLTKSPFGQPFDIYAGVNFTNVAQNITNVTADFGWNESLRGAVVILFPINEEPSKWSFSINSGTNLLATGPSDCHLSYITNWNCLYLEIARPHNHTFDISWAWKR